MSLPSARPVATYLPQTLVTLVGFGGNRVANESANGLDASDCSHEELKASAKTRNVPVL